MVLVEANNRSGNHYINERALSFSENDLGDPQRIAVSLVSGTVIMVNKKDDGDGVAIPRAANGDYEKWTLRGYSTKIPEGRNAAHYIFARLSRTDRTALIIFSLNNYNIDGSISTFTENEDGTKTESRTEASTEYYYIRIGYLSETDGTSDRVLTYDSGQLSVGYEIDEIRGEWNDLFIPHYDDPADPKKLTWIEAKSHMGIQGGVTMFIEGENMNLPNIYDGLPIDGDTLYWEEDEEGNKVLKAKGEDFEGTLGALKNVGEWADTAPEADRIMVQKKGGDAWEALSLEELGTASFENVKEDGEGNAYTAIELSEDKKTLTLKKGETFAKQTDYEALNTKVTDFLEGEDTDTIINKWKELEAFLDGMKESDDLAEILSGKADKGTTLADYGITDAYTKEEIDTTLGDYVTIGGNEEITGEKDFTGGLKVNGSPIVYNATDKYWKLEGDLLVTGGVTMYGNDSDFTPSTVMGALVLDPDTLKINEEGQLTVVGGTGGIDEEALKLYLDTNKYATQTWVGEQGFLTEHQSLDGYATEEWVEGKKYLTAITKSQVTTALGYTPYNSTNPNGYITSSGSISGNAATATNADKLDGTHDTGFYKSQAGTFEVDVLDTFANRNSGSYGITYRNASGSVGYSGMLSVLSRRNGSYGEGSVQSIELIANHYTLTQGALQVRLNVDGTRYSDVKTIAFADGNVASATKLATARKIWGQSFDGTSNVTGSLTGVTSITASGAVSVGTTLTVGGIDVKKSADGVLYIDGNLVVTGGITMYGTNATSAPSILDSLPIASTSKQGIAQFDASDFVVTNGVVSLNGNLGLDQTALAAYLTSWGGSGSIKTVGTITSGTWNGTKIANAYLANSSISISGTSVSLGGSITQAALRTALGLGSNAYTSTTFVDLTTAQTISAIKTFSSGIKMGKDCSIADSNDYGVLGVYPTEWVGLPTDGTAIGLGTTVGGVYIRTSADNLYHYNKNKQLNYLILDSNNYNSYAPTLTGMGASGTWGISVTGNAATATLASNSTKFAGYSMRDDSTFVNNTVDANIMYTVSLASLSTSNFYPVIFGPSPKDLYVRMHSTSGSNTLAYNQNKLEFTFRGQGWNDTPTGLTVHFYDCFSSSEMTIGSIGVDNMSGYRCVWLRGGLDYYIVSNCKPTLHSSGYTYTVPDSAGGTHTIKFSVGTGLGGGTNSNVGIYWYPQTTSRLEAMYHSGGLVTGASLEVKTFATVGTTLSVNGITLSKSQSDVLYIDANVVVRGGITMYGTNATSAPSILDSLPIASTSKQGIAQFDASDFVVTNGVVSLNGNLGLDHTALAAYLTSWGGSGSIKTVGTITSGTWNGTKIANAYLANSSISISGTSVSLGGSITQAALRTALGLGSNAYTSTAYLPLSGGTVKGGNLVVSASGSSGASAYDTTLAIYRTPSVIRFYDAAGNSLGYLGFSAANEPCMYDSTGASTTVKTLLHSGNYTDYTVTKGGSGASGTWGISVTGSAATLSSTTPQLAAATESNEIKVVNNSYGAITENEPETGAAITKAIQFRWYDNYWQIGAIRGSSKNSVGWGVTLGSSDLRFRVTSTGADVYGTLTASGGFDGNAATATLASNSTKFAGYSMRSASGWTTDSVDARIQYTISTTSLSTSNFYPIIFPSSSKDLYVCMYSTPGLASIAYNQNKLEFTFRGQGWSDAPQGLTVHYYDCYSSSETTIGRIGMGQEGGDKVVWVRGGLTYYIISNITPSLKTSTYTSGGEVYTVGTSLSGGTNTKVSIYWTPQTTSGLKDMYHLGGIRVHCDTAYGLTLTRGNASGGTYILYRPRNQSTYTWASGVDASYQFVWYYQDNSAGTDVAQMWLDRDNKLNFKSGANGRKLVVNGASAAIQFYATTSSGWVMGDFFYNNSGTNFGAIGAYGSAGTLSYYFVGSYQSPLLKVDPSGNITASGGITMYSDIRKKTKIKDVELTLKQVADAPLMEHYYNSDDKKTTHVGSIAQYWAGLNDWFCKPDKDGFYTMEIQNAALASAISIARELVKYESKTDRKIRLLKERISELEDKIEQLERKGE